MQIQAVHVVMYASSFCLRYLASSISFTEQTDVGLLTINLFKKDHVEFCLIWGKSCKRIVLAHKVLPSLQKRTIPHLKKTCVIGEAC